MMCSTDFGMLDFFLEKDPACKDLDNSFKNTFFSTDDRLEPDVKQEVVDAGTIDWKLANDWDADELLREVLEGSSDLSAASLDPLASMAAGEEPSSMAPHSLEAPDDDMDSLENLVGLPFHAVIDSGSSDSGLSSSDCSLDQQLSPMSGYSVSSPREDGGPGGALAASPPHPALDTTSDVSSTSDLASSPPASLFTSPCSPDTILVDDFLQTDSGFSSPVPQSVTDPMTLSTAPLIAAPQPAKPTIITRAAPKVVTTSTAAATPVFKTVTVAAAPPTSSVGSVGGQTIVVTQASKGSGQNAHLVRSGTLLKSGPNQASRSILLPVTVKDLNQVRTIKIISTGGSSTVGRGVRTVVSTVHTPSTTTAATLHHTGSQPIRTALLGSVRTVDSSKSLLKGGATTVLSTARPTVPVVHASPTRVKVEPLDDDDDDDDDTDSHTSFQQLTLSDEEKRLLKKEGILLPTHYPLTKQEERELKRIRRKIRNKISAQDSRKRKKEYIDGLEDRVKACTEENQQLQKRIRNLEVQNETLLNQMRRFQSVVTGGNAGRLQTHASTALMMLILSAALFIVPSVRQDGAPTDSELSIPVSKMPSAGHSRSLLEAGNMAVVSSNLETVEGVEDDLTGDMEASIIQALNDHDYTPVAKKQRTTSKSPAYYVPPLDEFPPQPGKQDSGGGFPPDDGSGTKLAARIMDSVVGQVSNNYSDPGGKHDGQAVVVNLGQKRKRLRDDLELE